MSRASQRELRANAEVHARAGLIASEFSLIGLGSATLLVTLLLLMLPDFGDLQLLRPGLAASAGLLGCGAALSVAGRWLDLGGTRRHARLAQLWWPLIACALLGARAWPGSGAIHGTQASGCHEGPPIDKSIFLEVSWRATATVGRWAARSKLARPLSARKLPRRRTNTKI